MPNETNDLSIIKRIEEQENISISRFYTKEEFDDFRKLSFAATCCLIPYENTITELAFNFCKLTNYGFLKELKNLSSLYLRYNHLTDVTFLKELKNLSSIYLRNNSLTDVTFLKELKNLSTLDLSSNNLTDVTFLKELKNLSTLDLRNNNLTDFTFLKELKNLTTLDLRYNNLTDSTFLKELKNLSTLDLRNNNLTDVTFLKELKNLSSLYLRNNNLTDFTFLKELKNLSTLDLSYYSLTNITFLKGLANLSTLYLRNNKLTYVTCLQELKYLSTLDLRNNKLTDVTFLKKLKNLSTLYLSKNKLTKVESLQELKKLSILNLSFNNITDVTFFKKLKNLSKLYLGHNNLTDFTFLEELKNLSVLDLQNNNLTDVAFPEELKNLHELNISNNKLTDVRFLKELKNLSILDLQNNNLTDVTFLEELKNLSQLYISNNKLTDVRFLKELKNLSRLSLTNNPIKIPPQKVWKEGIEAINNYFKQIEEQGTDYLYEAKIILIGEPGAGKTSLLKKIKDPAYFVPNPAEKETIGIQVEVDNYPHPTKPEINFRANIWDFGGQDIQYTIHQFFLTAEALYLLVLDDRKENTDYDYWFNIIGVLGEGSPVIVVVNEVNKLGFPNFDFAQYKNRYSDLNLEKREVDLSKNDGRLKELLEKIKLAVTQLKGIGTPLPKQWIPIRKELENLVQRNHISYDEFVEICKRNNLNETIDQEFLAQTFHRIGVFLHFSNDPNLYGTIFTNHKWVVDALYTILREKSLRETNGLFEKKRIFELWGNNYTNQEKNQLLSLMLKNNFDISYKVGDIKEEKYLFPVLLPPEKPDFVLSWDFKNNLRFRFQYKFMPKGIITRLIVRLSDYIHDYENKNIVWRTGAVLYKENSFAVVSEDIDRQGLKVIDLAVNGKENDKKEFLIIIKDELKRIHSSTFTNLPVNEMVPCVCKECSCSQEPYFFDYKNLEKYRTNNIPTIRCNKSTSLEEVDVNKLIEGYEDISEMNKDELDDNFLTRLQQPLPEITTVKQPEKDPWYRKWYYIIGIVGAIIVLMWNSMQIIKSCSRKEYEQDNYTSPKSIKQIKQDSTKNVIKDNSTNKKKINTKK